MEKELAFCALDQIADLELAQKVTFHVMGEPLLHPDFFEILDYAIDKGIRIGLTTNGSLLQPKMIERLATRDLHQIDISLQTPDAESFSCTRGTKMDFDKYKKGLLDLLAKVQSKENPPIFKIRIMTTRFAKSLRNKLAIPNFLATSQSLQDTVKDWTIEIREKLGKNIDLAELEKKVGQLRIYAWNVIEISPRIFIETYVLTDWGNAFTEKRIIPANYGYCFGMRDHFAILHSGDVILCCIDYEGKTAIGNLHNSTLKEILESETLIDIVEGFKRGKLVHDHCKSCLGTHSNISSWTKPALSYLGLKVFKPFFYRKYKLFP